MQHVLRRGLGEGPNRRTHGTQTLALRRANSQDKRAEHYLRAMATGNPSPDITPPEEKDNSQTLDAVELLNE